jgi:signal transduction histidine kinase
MKRLQLFILVFSLALCIPLAYFVLKTYRGLEREETATLSYFAETLFDEMEGALAEMVRKEEGRAIDEFNFRISPPVRQRGVKEQPLSPLSRLPRENYIVGYFQNNPDGSFQTPLVENESQIPPKLAGLVAELKKANEIFNRKRVEVSDRVESSSPESLGETGVEQKAGFADKYLSVSRSQRPKAYLGQQSKRREEISVSQAANIAKREQPAEIRRSRTAIEAEGGRLDRYGAEKESAESVSIPEKVMPRGSFPQVSAEAEPPAPSVDKDGKAGFQVEVAPLQAVFLSDTQIFIFRRIMINNQIYRQGFILKVNAFLEYLTRTYFLSQPMAQFAGLRLSVVDQGREAETLEAGAVSNNPGFILNRGFPSPFGFLKATLTCDRIPPAAGRRTLTIMLIVLAVIVLIGLFAIYQSARTIVDLSERRSQFVSSVTHELKTPLTNIRMYIEMLEQGIAKDPEREQEYFRILDSEGARLSRLINNVLELSKLEKKQRHIDLQPGTFEEVIAQVRAVMAEKLKQEGFTLDVVSGPVKPFKYDREVMIQVLINLIENSMKFGKRSPKRAIQIRIRSEDGKVKIMVADNGPGIPRHALKKIFNDFYRVENSLTRSTRGTGIGLALVKKFAHLMGGTVTAANNNGPGCTITISLPESKENEVGFF